jgi:hypothetical protein
MAGSASIDPSRFLHEHLAQASPRHDRHSEHSSERLLAGLDAGDPDGKVTAAWIAAQDLRLLYRHRDPPAPRRRSTGG